MIFELTGVARLRAGRAQVEVEARSLGDALAVLVIQAPGVVPDVVTPGGALSRHFMASCSGSAFTRDAALALDVDARVVIVGAQAGG